MLGLVLEGGGARGAYHIGAYKALLEEGFKFDGVCGTSIGAMNAAMIVQGDIKKAYELWQNISSETLFGIPIKSWRSIREEGIPLKELPKLLKTFQGVIKNKGLSRSKVKTLLNDLLDEKAIRKSKMDFGLVTYSLTDMKSLEYLKDDIPNGKMIDYILASSNLPVFQAEKMDGKILLDGGVYDNLPFQLLTKKGYEDLVLIRTFALGRVRKFDQHKVNSIIIEPSEDLGDILDFRPEKGKYLLNLGYFDVKRKFHNLKGNRYYFQPKNDEKYYIDFLVHLSSHGLDEMAKVLEFRELSDLRLVFEHIIPIIAEALDLPKSANYEDIVLGVAEWMAKKLKLERFKIYPVEDFFHLIRTESIKHPIFEKPKKIPTLILKSELGAKLFKENILHGISWFIASTGSILTEGRKRKNVSRGRSY